MSEAERVTFCERCGDTVPWGSSMCAGCRPPVSGARAKELVIWQSATILILAVVLGMAFFGSLELKRRGKEIGRLRDAEHEVRLMLTGSDEKIENFGAAIDRLRSSLAEERDRARSAEAAASKARTETEATESALRHERGERERAQALALNASRTIQTAAAEIDRLRKLNSELEARVKVLPDPEDPPQLELVDWKWWRDGDYVYAEGRIKNLGRQSISFVSLVINFYSREKVFVTHKLAFPTYTEIQPNQISPFSTMCRWNPLMLSAEIEAEHRGRRIEWVKR